MVHSIELKFSMYILGHYPTYCVEFGEFIIKVLLQEHKKEFLYFTAYGVKLQEVCLCLNGAFD